MMRNQSSLKYWLLACLLVFLASSCKKEVIPPDNPYDDIDYGNTGGSEYNPDPETITGIYELILRRKCSLPGCHDGHFEPDFRSIQTSWSTLVYQTPVKNTADSAFDYRVLPGDADNSMLMHRLTTGDAQLQRMPATGSYLSTDQLDNIRTWINDGAKDMFGNAPGMPNSEPLIQGFVAFNQGFTQQIDRTENRLDSLPYNPFKVSIDSTFNIVVVVEDDITPVNMLQVNQLKLSLDKDNFSGAAVKQATFINFPGFAFWVTSVNPATFSIGDTVYMRYYVNDGSQPQDTEFPRTDLPDPYKTYAAFYLTP
jgi:hypothetical protein